MDPVTLDQLLVFLEVAEAGSFSEAARRQHRAQSAVSYAVANLESQLELQLFERRGQRPVLSEAGRSLLPYAKSVVAEMDSLRAHARSMAAGTEARLGLAIDALLPFEPLLGVLRDFRLQFPEVALLIHSEALGGVLQLVLDGTCQLGLRAAVGRPPAGLIQVPLTTTRLIFVASPEHPLARIEGPVPTAVLDQHVQLVLTDRSQRTAGDDHGVLSSRTWRLADLAAKHAFLRAGFGWGSLPSHLAEPDLAAGELVRLKPAEMGSSEACVTHEAVYRSSDPPGRAGSWLLERLGHALASDRAPADGGP
ncbi:MAG: LysR family transcriptional regulator [Deltaproteobacteria bacterium]|jgi:DNA-binding transcriptional LysR family regulator|nr:LysR family transcriptional regulator [Deltaproteobacteria bacterium]MBW2533861.1 LysR family transcriptional regulator [Deltaproteobacteria bacterium]